MLELNNDLILRVNNIAIQAGSKIMQYYLKNSKIITKNDNSPLTKADLASNQIIIEELKKIDETIPLLSEETLIDWRVRKKWKKYWLIDPLDGTKEFIKKNGEFTVNIALIDNNKPLLGIIYAPAKSLLYYGCQNCGAFKILSSKKLKHLKDSKLIKVSNSNTKENIRVISSRSHSSKTLESWIENKLNNYTLIVSGSSLKFCSIAEGEADVYPRFGPTSEWDIAAGHAILKEAGGIIRDFEGNDMLYNKKESLINSDFIATNSVKLI